jgi:hypothetical protein
MGLIQVSKKLPNSRARLSESVSIGFVFFSTYFARDHLDRIYVIIIKYMIFSIEASNRFEQNPTTPRRSNESFIPTIDARKTKSYGSKATYLEANEWTREGRRLSRSPPSTRGDDLYSFSSELILYACVMLTALNHAATRIRNESKIVNMLRIGPRMFIP